MRTTRRPVQRTQGGSSTNKVLVAVVVVLCLVVGALVLKSVGDEKKARAEDKAKSEKADQDIQRTLDNFAGGGSSAKESPAKAPPPIAQSARDSVIDDAVRKKAEKLVADGYVQIKLGNAQRGLNMFNEANALVPSIAPVEIVDPSVKDVWKKRVRVNGGEQTLEHIYARGQRVQAVQAEQRQQP